MYIFVMYVYLRHLRNKYVIVFTPLSECFMYTHVSMLGGYFKPSNVNITPLYVISGAGLVGGKAPHLRWLEATGASTMLTC